MAIVTNIEGFVIGYGIDIQRVNEQDELNLIKVTVHNDGPNNYYYIGTEDRDFYTIYNQIDVPHEGGWMYIDGVFTEITDEEEEI